VWGELHGVTVTHTSLRTSLCSTLGRLQKHYNTEKFSGHGCVHLFARCPAPPRPRVCARVCAVAPAGPGILRTGAHENRNANEDSLSHTAASTFVVDT